MPGVLSSIIVPMCPTHMFYLVLFLLLPNLTISSNTLFPTFLIFLSLYHSQIGPTRVCLILMIFPSLVCLLLFFSKVFRQWSRICNEPVSQARPAAAISLFDQSVSQARS